MHPNGKGEYRTVNTTGGLDLDSITCPTDARCDPNTDDGWFHVAAVYTKAAMVNGVSYGNTFSLYVDGVLQATSVFTESKLPKLDEYEHPLLVGAGFEGQIDDASLFNVALAIDEIKESMYCPQRVSIPLVNEARYSFAGGVP